MKSYSLSFLLLVLFVALISGPACAQDGSVGKVIKLWEGGAPGALGDTERDQPTITVSLPEGESANRSAVVVCPGGGYGALAFNHEGIQVARWLNSLGVAAVILRYRYGPQYGHPIPLGDAQRAVRMTRWHAKEWGIDPDRIGIMGFSAGGHLASTAGTHFDSGNPDSEDEIDRVSSRPDFMILIYPVISMLDGVTHEGSRRNLLGEHPDPELLWLLSNEKQVSPNTPPTFLVHTTEDEAVPVENSLRFYRALVEAGVPAEMHVYERGRHGFGLAPGDSVLSTWPKHAAMWLESHGFIIPAPNE